MRNIELKYATIKHPVNKQIFEHNIQIQFCFIFSILCIKCSLLIFFSLTN